MSASEQKTSDSTGAGSRRISRSLALVAPALLLLIVAIGMPLLVIVVRSLSEPEWGFQNYVWFFGTPVNLLVLQRTFTISAWVTIVCVICAYPYALMMTAVGPKMRMVLVLCVLISVLGERCGAYAVMGHSPAGHWRNQFYPERYGI